MVSTPVVLEDHFRLIAMGSKDLTQEEAPASSGVHTLVDLTEGHAR
ncbi:MAG: hypothetical protein K0041_06410 [Acidithiobacillus sp.]|nr:hypothetical protein [Acidithiobacillus sp.]